jgi:tungstate transport system ATP-binding protein
MNEALVELRDCAVRVGRTQALAPLTLTLRRGERVALVGSNGSDKTTPLRLLHGQLGPHLSQGRRRAVPHGGLAEVAQGMVYQRPFPLRLSVAQQQRLALARAWAVRPQLLFLDEPTARLDPGAKREVEALISGIADEGVTVVMSTHNLGQAKRLAGRLIYLDGGHVVADLPSARFFDGPLPEAEQRFVKGELA